MKVQKILNKRQKYKRKIKNTKDKILKLNKRF